MTGSPPVPRSRPRCGRRAPKKPRKLIAAIPIGPEDTLRRLAQRSDKLVCLRVPEDFYALSKFYLHFEQVDDAQVLEILRSHNPAPRKQ